MAPLAPRDRQILALQTTRSFITTTVVLGKSLSMTWSSLVNKPKRLLLNCVPWCLTMPEIFLRWRGTRIIAPPHLKPRTRVPITGNETNGWRVPKVVLQRSLPGSKQGCSTSSTPLYAPPHWSRWCMLGFVLLFIVAKDTSPKRPSISSCFPRTIIATKAADDKGRRPLNS